MVVYTRAMCKKRELSLNKNIYRGFRYSDNSYKVKIDDFYNYDNNNTVYLKDNINILVKKEIDKMNLLDIDSKLEKLKELLSNKKIVKYLIDPENIEFSSVDKNKGYMACMLILNITLHYCNIHEALNKSANVESMIDKQTISLNNLYKFIAEYRDIFRNSKIYAIKKVYFTIKDKLFCYMNHYKGILSFHLIFIHLYPEYYNENIKPITSKINLGTCMGNTKDYYKNDKFYNSLLKKYRYFLDY